MSIRIVKGVERASAANGVTEVWLGSLVFASATARALARRDEVTLAVSALPGEGEEDLACAEPIAALLQGAPHSKEAVVAAVRSSRAAAKHRSDDPDLPLEDVDCAAAVDTFQFAMKGERRSGHFIAKPFFTEVIST